MLSCRSSETLVQGQWEERTELHSPLTRSPQREERLLSAAARRRKRRVLVQECFFLGDMRIRIWATVTLIRQELVGSQVFYSSLAFQFPSISLQLCFGLCFLILLSLSEAALIWVFLTIGRNVSSKLDLLGNGGTLDWPLFLQFAIFYATLDFAVMWKDLKRGIL